MRASEFTLVEGINMQALAQRARQLLAQGMSEQQAQDALVKQGIPARLAAQAVQMAQMNETVADQLTQENQPSDTIEKLKAAFKGKSPVSDKVKYGDTAYPQDKNKSVKEAPIAATDDPNQPKGMKRQKIDPSYNVDEEFAGAKVGHKAGLAGQLKAKAKVNVKGTVLGSPEKSQKGLRGKLVGGSMEEELEQLEERRRKRRKARRASYGPGAWGPGPYGGYGYNAGYSGDMGGGGDGGGESIHELFDGGKDWRWTYQDKNQASAEFTVGDVHYTFMAGQDPDEAPGDWDIEFAAKKEAGTASWGLTGTGNSAQVFGTVVEIMKAFIASKKASIRRMTFAAKEDSRQGLYARMVNRLLPKWNLEQKGEAFVLTRPGGLAFWVYSVEAPYNKIPAVKVKANTASEAEQIVLTTMPEFKGADLMGMGASKNKPNLDENFADGRNPGRKELDPDVYEDLANSIIARVARQIVPTIRAKSTPEGYVYLSTLDGLSLVIGCNIAGGSIDINLGSQPMETASSGPHKGAVTKIIAAVYQAAVKQYGEPTEQGTLSIDHDAGHGVWQHIAQRLGLQYDAHMVKENFADGKNPQDKGDSKRHGVPTKASVSTLRKVAKQGGRKGQLAHWMANMKAGRAKKK